MNAGASERMARLVELAALGAERAARVLADFAGVAAQAGPARPIAVLKAPPYDTGVIFQIEGALCGDLALFVDPRSRRSLVRLLLDEEETEAPPDLVESALCELANIIASQAVSAIADALASRISLSVPRLWLELAPVRLAEARAQRAAAASDLSLSSELCAPDLEMRILLVVMPDL